MTATAQELSMSQFLNEETDADKLARETVVLVIKYRTAGGFKKRLDSRKMVQEGTGNHRRFHISKDLIDPDALSPVTTAKSRIKTWLDGRAVPCSMLHNSMRLIPLGLIQEVDEGLEAFRQEWKRIVEKAVIAKLDELKAKAREDLKEFYSDADYPSPESILEGYDVEWSYMSYNVPAALERANKAIAERETARISKELRDAGDEMQLALREGLAEMVERLLNSLGTTEGGAQKRLYDTTVTQLQDFLRVFDARNLTNDGELAEQVKAARKLIAGLTPNQLKKGDARERVRDGMSQISKQLDTLVVSRKRGFRFAEEN